MSKWVSIYNGDLSTPDEVYKYFEDPNALKYCQYIDEVNGVPMLRTWQCSSTKKYGKRIREIARRLMGDTAHINCTVDWYGMAGWKVFWDEPFISDWWALENKKAGWFYGKILNKGDYLNKYPYCQWETVKQENYMNFFEYLTIYTQNPKVELLIKAGYARMITGLRYLNLTAKSLDKILKVKPKWVDYLKGKGINELLACRKFPNSDEDYIDRYLTVKHKRTINKCLKYSHSGPYLNYLLKVKTEWDAHLLVDYYSTCELMGVPLKEKKYLMPENIQIAHDEMSKTYKIHESEILTKQMMKRYDELSKYFFEGKEMIIFAPKSVQELENESKILEHCVRTYSQRYADGETDIFFLRKAEKPEMPYITIEERKGIIIQVRGYKNNVITPLEQIVKDTVMDWSKQNNWRYSG